VDERSAGRPGPWDETNRMLARAFVLCGGEHSFCLGDSRTRMRSCEGEDYPFGDHGGQRKKSAAGLHLFILFGLFALDVLHVKCAPTT
jgi:hypothetical protein